jgi:hypothetical protein
MENVGTCENVIQTKMNALDKCIDELKEISDLVCTRLEPITTPDCPSPTSDCETAKMAEESRLARDLGQSTDRIITVVRQWRSVANRLQV